jgi:hypothetical protein
MTGPAGSNTFAGAPALTLEAGDTVTCAATNMTVMTKETGEPIQAGGATQTAWWTFTPAVNVSFRFDTLLGPDGTDTVLAVYSGSAVNALTLVGYNDDDDPGDGARSQLVVLLAAGTTYRIQAHPYNNGDANSIVLRAALVAVLPDPTPPTGGQGSDYFQYATPFEYGGSSVPTPSTGLTREPDEPDPLAPQGIFITRTAWWVFTAPASETVGVDLLQSIYASGATYASTAINVYTGSSIGALTLMAQGSVNSRPGYPALPYTYLTEMDFEATAGTTYYVQVGLQSYSPDVDYVLRLGRRVVTYSDWVSTPPYDKAVSWWTGPFPRYDVMGSGYRKVEQAGTVVVESAQTVTQASVDAAIAALTSATTVINTNPVYSNTIRANPGFSQFTDPGENVDWDTHVEIHAQSYRPVVPLPSIPPDPDAAGYEWSGPYCLVDAAVFNSADAVYTTAKAKFPAPHAARVNTTPDIPMVFDMVVLQNVTNYTDRMSWNLTNRRTVAHFSVSASSPTPAPHSEMNVDISDCIGSRGEFVLINWMPVSVPSLPLEFGTQTLSIQAGGNQVADPVNNTITFHVIPPDYRYVYRTIDSGGGGGVGVGVLKVWSEADNEWLWQGHGSVSGATGVGRFKVWDGDEWQVAEPVAGEGGTGRLKVWDGSQWIITSTVGVAAP